MSSFKSVIIEASRENSVDVSTFGLTDERSGNPATWTNLTNIQLNEGDEVSVQCAFIHSIGSDNDSTIELTNQADPRTGITDNQVLLQFSPYVSNTGGNFVVAPYVGVNSLGFPYNPVYNDGVTNHFGIEYTQIIPQKSFRNAPVSEGGTASGKKNTPLYGCPISDTCGDGLNSGYKFTPRRYDATAVFPRVDTNPNSPMFVKSSNLLEKIDGSRFVKVNRLYKSPFKKEDGTFFSNDEDGTGFFIEKFEVPIQIEAPKYEAPNIICNKINEILHSTGSQSNNSFTFEEKAFENHNELLPMTRFAGKMFQYFAANAEVPDTDSYRDNNGNKANRFWGQICVKDANRWQYQIHYPMRLELNVESYIPPGQATAYPISYPCYWSSKYNAFRDSVGHPLHDTYRFPTIRLDNPHTGTNPRQYRYYSTLPEYFLVATNIKWTQDNVNILIDMMKNNEIYEGTHDTEEDANNDIINWYITLDIHRTDECNNGIDSSDATARHPGGGGNDRYYDPWNGGTFADKDKYNLLDKWVKWDEKTRNALKPLQPYYMTEYTPMDQISMEADDFPTPSQNYIRSDYNFASNNRILGEMKKAGTFTAYSRFLPEWKKKYVLRNFPDNFDSPQIYGDGMPSTTSNGNEFFDGFSVPIHNLDVGGMGLYPIKIFEPDGTHHISVAYMVYNPTAYRDPVTQRWFVDDKESRLNGYTGRTIRPCWSIPQLSYANGSPSSMDNPYGLLINNNVTDNFDEGFSNGNDDAVAEPNSEYQGIPNSMNGFCNAVFLGANDPTCTFDTSLSRTAFENLHTERLLGASELIFKKGSTTDIIGENLGQQCVIFNDAMFPNGHFDQLKYDGSKVGKPSDPKLTNDSRSTGTFSDSLSGVYLNKVFFQERGQLIQSSTDSKAIESSETNFYNTLLYKLGFRYHDLFPVFGNSNSRHNQGFQGDYSRLNRYSNVKPLTTNEDLTISIQPSTNLLDGAQSFDATGSGEPEYKLSLGSFNRYNIAAPGSTQILASRLPVRLDTPFYLIYSDIIISDYHQEEKQLSVVGIATKAYTSGDFIISLSDNSFGQITNSKSHYLKSITTQIRTANGELAAISEKSSVIYKIIKPYSVPTPQMIMNPQPTPQEQALTQLKKQNKNLEDLIDIMGELLNQKLDKKK